MKYVVRTVLALALPAAHPVAAQDSSSRRVAEAVRDVVAHDYVIADVRVRLDRLLTANIAARRYDGLAEEALAQRITDDMAAVAHDKHLGLRLDPGMASHMPAPVRDDAAPADPFWLRFARSHNHGVTRLEVLDGNVRKLTLDGFVHTGPDSERALAQAVSFLRGGDAAIIDLRTNGGGDPAAVRYLTSHFVAPGTKLVTFHLRSDRPTTSTSVAVPGPGWNAMPLYVLTSSRSASAAEEFAAHVARLKFGTLVGETTAGAAFRNELYPIARRYVLSVSIGYPELPGSGNWEGKGIAPAIPARADLAEHAALADAYRKLASRPGEEQQAYRWFAMAQQARLSPAVPALPLSAYPGHYAANREIRLTATGLTSRRGGGPESRLLPITPDRFVLEGDAGTQIVFRTIDGKVSGMTVERVGGASEMIDRLAS